MKKLLIFFSFISCLVACQNDNETINKITYEKNYEFVVDVPEVNKNTIFDSISIWLNSEFPEKDINSNDKAKNFAQTFMALDSPGWANTFIDHKQQNIKNVTTNNPDLNIFECSIKNIVIETQNEKWGAGGRWIVANADIMVQIKDGKYKVSWENVTVNKLKVSYFGTDSRKIPQTTIKEKNYGKLITTLESTSNNLKECIKKTNNDW